MSKCRWPDGSCPNEATKVVYRRATDEEQKAGEVVTPYSSTRPGLFETNVCDHPLEEAQKVYTMIADKEP